MSDATIARPLTPDLIDDLNSLEARINDIEKGLHTGFLGIDAQTGGRIAWGESSLFVTAGDGLATITTLPWIEAHYYFGAQLVPAAGNPQLSHYMRWSGPTWTNIGEAAWNSSTSMGATLKWISIGK